jgi:hypothetical protein
VRGTVAKRLRKVARQLTDHIIGESPQHPLSITGTEERLYKRGKQLFNQRTRRTK